MVDIYSDTTIKERYEIYITELDITLKMSWWERIYYFFDCKNKIKMSQLIEVQNRMLEELYEELAHVDHSYNTIKDKLETIKSHLD